jgi:hypothetical protein
MSRRRRSWWRTPLTILGWSLALGIAYVIISQASNNENPTGLYLVIGILVFNYAVSSVTEKLDMILWKLEDIEERLSPQDHSILDETYNAEPQPPPLPSSPPPPLPGSIEAYQQQFRRPKRDSSAIDRYQEQFWKK